MCSTGKCKPCRVQRIPRLDKSGGKQTTLALLAYCEKIRNQQAIDHMRHILKGQEHVT